MEKLKVYEGACVNYGTTSGTISTLFRLIKKVNRSTQNAQ